MTRAVLFDLGHTLVSYYAPHEFPSVLRECLTECCMTLGWPADPDRDRHLLERALSFNQERPDFAVRLLGDRLQQILGAQETLDEDVLRRLTAAFLKPIFAMARPDPSAAAVLHSLREHGIKTAIVSNTPWGSPADAWRGELKRHGLLEAVDAVVFCVDIGWRKPHRAPFDQALSLLDVQPHETLFVGDDHRWDVIGAQNAGIRPVLLVREASTSSDCLTIHSLSEIVSIADESHRQR
jgi:putative hydrolase of the HAD superfamily